MITIKWAVVWLDYIVRTSHFWKKGKTQDGGEITVDERTVGKYMDICTKPKLSASMLPKKLWYTCKRKVVSKVAVLNLDA